MRFRGLLTLLCGLILAVGCTYDSDIDTSGFGSEGDGVTTVNIRATLPEFGGVTRGVNSAKGGTTNIDWGKYSLRVIIKAFGDESEPVEYRGKEAASEVRYFDGTSDGRVDINLDMPLTSGHKYDIYMWADYVEKGSTEDLHYDTADFPAIALKHDVPVINDESLDAFYGKAEITVGDGYYLWDEGSQFPISRAVAKLRMVATDANSASATSATLQTDMFYTGFNIATGELTKSAAAVKSEMTRFETYTVENSSTTTKSFITAYMLWPAEESTNIVAEFYDGSDQVISTIKPANAIPLKRGNLTTLRGALLVTDSGWDGNVEQPEVLGGDTLVVSTPGQLLWLVKNGAKVGDTEYKKIRLGADINVNNQAVISPLKLYDDTDFDGNGKTLKGLGVPTTALFGSVQGLNAYNFTLEGYNVSAQDGHVGVLVNELNRSATFTDITIKNSTAKTSNGAAGGIVGYVGGGSSVDLDVVFTNCDLENVKADGTSAEGKFVGLMQGYDNGETLSFDADCSVDGSCGVADYASPYTESNDAQWLDGDVATYPKSFDFSAYNGWLGDEEMYRAVVSFAGKRMQIKWDGVTKVEPLKDASGSILIYSPFDLASLQQTVVRTGTDYPYTYTWSGRTSWGTVIFESDVDLGGVCDKCREENCICTKAGKGICDCTECRKFTPIRSIKTLDGKNHTVYNLHIDLVHDGDGMAFMQTTVSGAVHKDITFVGANIKTDHDRNIPVCNYAQEDNGSGNGYGGTFVSATGGGTYTISNVHVKDGKVSGVCKIGGLIGKAGCATLNMTNCSVDNYVVENYEANRPNYYPIVMEGSMSVTCLEWWYTQGECGGLIGFVQCSSVANIEGCSVTNTHMNCYDQPNKTVTANVISGSYSGMSPTTKDSTLARGSTLIAGRHVNQFIGDVVSARTSDSNTTTYVVNIKDYYVDGNTYRGDVAASSTNNYNHAYEQKNTGSSWRPNYVNSAWCEVVGCAYYVGVEININLGLTKYQKHVRHYAGTLTFNKKNGSTITLTENASEANGIKWIGGNFSIEGIGGKTNYPPAPSASEIGE